MNSRRFLAAGASLLLTLAAGFILGQVGLPHIPQLTLAPSFEALTINQERLSVSQHLNRPLVINFWATWCQPCVIEMPRLEAAYQSEVLVVGINAGEDPAKVQAWVKHYAISFPIVIDPYGELEKAYQVKGFPTTFFIDRQGRVQKIYQGLLSEDDLKRGLASIGVKNNG